MAYGRKWLLAHCARGAVRYLARRISNPFINSVGGEVLKKGAEGAGVAMAPSRIDIGELRAGLFRRLSDNGAARFAESMHAQGVTDGQLTRFVRNLGVSAVAMLLATSGFLASGAIQIAAASQGRQLLCGFAMAFAAFIFLALSARHDFRSWQLKCRRFGSLQEYIREKEAAAKKLRKSVK